MTISIQPHAIYFVQKFKHINSSTYTDVYRTKMLKSSKAERTSRCAIDVIINVEENQAQSVDN
jgi:hypothetical protein